METQVKCVRIGAFAEGKRGKTEREKKMSSRQET